MWAVVGLGNPGRRYASTRHNVGFAFIRSIAREWKVRLRKRMFFSKAIELDWENEKVLLAMPQTYMNKSGIAVREILKGRNIEPESLIVVYDDLDVSLGEIRIRKKGGPGTHKGMGSIVQELQAMEFPRIRIGVGPLSYGEDATRYVLSSFDKKEKVLLEESLRRARGALKMILSGEMDKAMNVYNKRGKALRD